LSAVCQVVYCWLCSAVSPLIRKYYFSSFHLSLKNICIEFYKLHIFVKISSSTKLHRSLCLCSLTPTYHCSVMWSWVCAHSSPPYILVLLNIDQYPLLKM
jgi:hypothetical protein